MFGSKLRSWMETHIGRPRKKNNKNKQSDSSNGGCGTSKKAGTLPQTSNLKSTTSPVLTSSGSHSIASPVRRREVSPIQCHTPSRYGWHSPDQDNSITSPKSDNLLYAPQRYQRHQTLQPLQQQQQQQQPQLSVPSKDSCSSSADKSPMRVNCSSSSISSLSWSTGSKEPSSAKQQLNFKLEHNEYHAPPAEDEVDYEEVGALLLRPQPPLPLQDYQRPNSENLASLQLIYDEEKQSKKNSNHVHYGRLLPSKLATVQLVESMESLNMTPPPPSVTNQLGRMRAPRAGLPRGNFMPGPRPHSLSSPESAYSTGYSTDGTSPCAASNANPPAPEYYINMRTGTHYFPSRSVNSERYKFGLNRIEEMSPMDPLPKSNFGTTLEANPSPLALQHQLFESPSPRQRSRIRTNPWYNTAEHLQLMPGSSRLEPDATSTTSTISSGIKSSNELEMRSAKTTTTTTKTNLASATGIATPSKLTTVSAESSEGSSSSSTEVENLHAPHTIKRRHLEQHQKQQQQVEPFLVSDDEATLNEMIGKFDESYVYEKETDILSSDSDPTDCASELDTGQDAGDECDTDELLDIDFIDTSSMQEVERLDQQRNLGSCHYYPNPSPLILRRTSTRSHRRSGQEPPDGSQQRRRKRFLKTRKKSCENREKVSESPMREPRGTRSVGGTPVCLRRQLLGKERIYKTSPLSNRSNSLIFGRANEQHFMTIAESEKALLKADLEADMKYKQLIMEAESLLESMKNSLQSIPRDTPVASPRRLNPLANKRVEMLKNSEVEAKKQVAPPSTPPLEHELAAAINKRIELLKFETSSTASPPNSPKTGRCSPRKTHLTNFINQNAPPELPPRKLNAAPPSPQLQLNGRRLQSGCSPRSSRRATHALQCINGSDSEQECIAVVRQSIEDVTNHNYLQQEQEQQSQQQQSYNHQDYNNRNVVEQLQQQDNFYCPHSEPLKRKVYKGSSSFERIKKTFDLELEISERPKTHVKRQQSKLSASVSAKSSMQDVTVEGASKQQQLILSTIVDLKRSLEHQSYELSGLTEE